MATFLGITGPECAQKNLAHAERQGPFERCQCSCRPAVCDSLRMPVSSCVRNSVPLRTNMASKVISKSGRPPNKEERHQPNTVRLECAGTHRSIAPAA